MSLFLEAHSLTGDSLGSYGFYRHNSAIWPLTKYANTISPEILKTQFIYKENYLNLCQVYGDRSANECFQYMSVSVHNNSYLIYICLGLNNYFVPAMEYLY